MRWRIASTPGLPAMSVWSMQVPLVELRADRSGHTRAGVPSTAQRPGVSTGPIRDTPCRRACGGHRHWPAGYLPQEQQTSSDALLDPVARQLLHSGVRGEASTPVPQLLHILRHRGSEAVGHRTREADARHGASQAVACLR